MSEPIDDTTQKTDGSVSASIVKNNITSLSALDETMSLENRESSTNASLFFTENTLLEKTISDKPAPEIKLYGLSKPERVIVKGKTT